MFEIKNRIYNIHIRGISLYTGPNICILTKFVTVFKSIVLDNSVFKSIMFWTTLKHECRCELKKGFIDKIDKNVV